MALVELQARLQALYHDARQASTTGGALLANPLVDLRDTPQPFPTATYEAPNGIQYFISDEAPLFVYAVAWWLPIPDGYHGLSAAAAAAAIAAGAIPLGQAPILAGLSIVGEDLGVSLRRTPRWITPPRQRRARVPRFPREPRAPRQPRRPRPRRKPREPRQARASRPARSSRPRRPPRPPREPRPRRQKTAKERGVCLISFDGCWTPGGCYPASYVAAVAKSTWACKKADCRGPNDCIKGDCGTQASGAIKSILSFLPKSWQASPPPAPPPRSLAGPARPPRPRLRTLPAPPPAGTGALGAPITGRPRCPCGAVGYCWDAGCDCRLPRGGPYPACP